MCIRMKYFHWQDRPQISVKRGEEIIIIISDQDIIGEHIHHEMISIFLCHFVRYTSAID